MLFLLRMQAISVPRRNDAQLARIACRMLITRRLLGLCEVERVFSVLGAYAVNGAIASADRLCFLNDFFL